MSENEFKIVSKSPNGTLSHKEAWTSSPLNSHSHKKNQLSHKKIKSLNNKNGQLKNKTNSIINLKKMQRKYIMHEMMMKLEMIYFP